ncbi:unnamed protein product [Eruca vesicaria subsp. sativa]|uniref:Uncharacterized protein n=1 Tax=Eruca vesicaria subsp. sativa TaxID=29727 RepID=A0ABC8KKV5_ERUVS|nr:unnamed protein product [Eruca vesicaria subsp. sativa]
MEEADGLSFDFKGGLDSAPVHPTASVPVAAPKNSSSAAVNLTPNYDHSSATYDKARMPICQFFRLHGECREQDCVYKHTNEGIKECNMYKLGFCPNGPDCRYRHAKPPGPPPPVEEVLQKIQQLTSYNHGTNRVQVQTQGQPQESGNLQQPQHQVSQTQTQNPAEQTSYAHPLPRGVNRYFVVKSCKLENFELSVQRGVWATQRSNEAKLNEAFDSVANVILIFSVNWTRHFQGCAKMTSRIGGYIGRENWKHEHETAQFGRNFSVKWLKLCELSFHKTRNLRNPYNENLPVKISRDCQELVLLHHRSQCMNLNSVMLKISF